MNAQSLPTSHSGASQLRFAKRLLFAGIAAAGLFEIAALGLENVQLRRHPMDYLIARLDAHAVNAEVVVMGDSVTKSVVDWYDVGPSIANLTDNRSSGVIGMKFVLARYLARNVPPKLIYIAATPESLSYVPGNSFDYYVGSVFKRPDERAWLGRHVPGYGLGNWSPAIFDAKRRVAQPLFVVTLPPPQPATDGHRDAAAVDVLEEEQGRFVAAAALEGRLDHGLGLGKTAAKAVADICLTAEKPGAQLVLAWAPTPARVYERWRRKLRLPALQKAIATVHDGACSGVIFHDFNADRSYPDHAFRDPEHLRRPGWAALYARQLRRRISEAASQ